MARYSKLLIHDAIGIFGFSLTASVLPKGLAARWLGLGARFHRGHPDIDAAEEAAGRCWPERAFDRREFRRMTLAEAAAAWRLMFGRRLDVTLNGHWPRSPGFAAIGGHYGAGIAVLWSLREAGLRPRFALHPPNRGQLRHRPLGYLWSLLRFRLVRRLCPDGPVVTPGAYEALDRILGEGATTPVLLLDTPATTVEADDSRWAIELGRCRLPLRRGARALIDKHDVDRVMFWARSCSGTGEVRIDIEPMAGSLSDCWPPAARRIIEAQPEQWQFWPFIRGTLADSTPGDESSEASRNSA
ncbi:hypothetical protein HFP89_08940 [Wenzhouxiangella sp. XN79A]|uniref:hypothetical protein n=1 Tax=Wenzhouxiangella sp. XN79A TaxID=2724193 RepID=UPI00144AAC13|nr:hypothetical protein [Wenzhouxiangella sp. XN79A]NKI35291.1 hypothetical protein [Wenzhouxiangella sp. XN79A]